MSIYVIFTSTHISFEEDELVQRLHNARVLGGVNDSEVVDGGHYDDSEFSFGHDHDYVQIGGAIRSTCDLSETEIHDLISDRNEQRRMREFDRADDIRDELKRHGVYIHDKAKAWRADGGTSFPSFTHEREQKLNTFGHDKHGSEIEFGHDYTQVGKPINKSVCDLSLTEIHNLICDRIQCKRNGDFQGADKIQEELKRHGVAIHDDAKAWRADGGKTFPKKQNNRRITKRTRNKVPNMKEEEHINRTNRTVGTSKIPNMKDCKTIDEAIKGIHDNLQQATHRNIASFWAAVPRLMKDERRTGQLAPQLEAIFIKTAKDIGGFGPRDLATTSLAFAKIVKSLTESNRRLGNGRRNSYHEFLHNNLEGEKCENIFQFIANTARPILSQFDGRCLANLAYAFAIIEYVPKFDDDSTLFHHIAEQSIPLVCEFKPQELANTIWAFEKVKVSHPDLFKKVGDRIVALDHLNDFAPQDFASIVQAFAKAEVSHPRLMDKLTDHLIGLDNFQVEFFNQREISSLVRGFSKLNVHNTQLLYKLTNSGLIEEDMVVKKDIFLSSTLFDVLMTK